VPVQDRPAKGRAYLLVAGCFITGGVSAFLAVLDFRRELPSSQTGWGIVLAFASWGLAYLLHPDDKRQRELLTWVGMALMVAGMILALVGFSGLASMSCNCGG
jgi:hypothetical protein